MQPSVACCTGCLNNDVSVSAAVLYVSKFIDSLQVTPSTRAHSRLPCAVSARFSPCLCHTEDCDCLPSVGHVIYHGPVNNVMDFFEGQGFRIPERKGIPDFLQEVTSYKDQAVSLVWVGLGSCCL